MTGTPRLLDLFCGAGGAAMGYQRAGFHVTGVDNRPQPNYCGDEFIDADALEVLRDEYTDFDSYAAIHAAPLWFRSARLTRHRETVDRHEEQIAPTLELLKSTGLSWVLEQGSLDHSPDAILMCGPSCGLGVIRHMWFLTSFPLLVPPCSHRNADGTYVAYASTAIGENGRYFGGRIRPPRQKFSEWKREADLEWMGTAEARLASPPAYTELIGHQLVRHLAARAAA